MTSPTDERIPQFTQGDRLRKARSLTGLSTRDFAQHLGVSHGTITNAEGDKRMVRRITLIAWSMATGVPMKWLETGVAPGPDDGPEGDMLLPRLDSNQQPSGLQYAQVA